MEEEHDRVDSQGNDLSRSPSTFLFFQTVSAHRPSPLHSAQLIHLSSILETNSAPLLRRLARTRNRRKLSATIDVSPNNSRFSATDGCFEFVFSIPSLSSVDAIPMATSASPLPSSDIFLRRRSRRAIKRCFSLLDHSATPEQSSSAGQAATDLRSIVLSLFECRSPWINGGRSGNDRAKHLHLLIARSFVLCFFSRSYESKQHRSKSKDR
jgi:hypothetical protein